MEDNKSSAQKTVRSTTPAPHVPGVKTARLQPDLAVPSLAALAAVATRQRPEPGGWTESPDAGAGSVQAGGRFSRATPDRRKPARGRAPRESRVRFPAILLESDRPSTVAASETTPRERGPAPTRPPSESSGSPGELPEGYGTQRLFLTARDPQWLYAHWDLTREQQRRYNALATDGHLVLRIHLDSPGGALAAQTHVHPESRHWFVHVGRAATKYVADLGYHRPGGRWNSICVSAATVTPPERMSADPSVRYASFPPGVLFARPRPLAGAAAGERLALDADPLLLQAPGQIEAEAAPGPIAPALTAESERALAETARLEPSVREATPAFPGAEWRWSDEENASLAAVPPPAEEPRAVSSAVGETAPAPAKTFRLSVNAELVIYGATEPDAVVSIGGRSIALRPDGSFSCRIALPDGHHDLSVLATSADGADARWADLEFVRRTRCGGGAGGLPPETAPARPGPNQP